MMTFLIQVQKEDAHFIKSVVRELNVINYTFQNTPYKFYVNIILKKLLSLSFEMTCYFYIFL